MDGVYSYRKRWVKTPSPPLIWTWLEFNLLMSNTAKGRTCTKCQKYKLYLEFYRDKKGKDGYMAECKECFLAGRKNYRDKNRDVLNLKSSKNYYKTKKENPDKIKNRWRKDRKNNSKRRNEYDKKWRKNNIDKTTEYRHTRRAIEKSLPFEYGISKTELIHKQDKRCANCKRKESRIPRHTKGHKWELDHIEPRKTGGGHTKDNVQILCWKCNRKKGYKSPTEWAKENGRLL